MKSQALVDFLVEFKEPKIVVEALTCETEIVGEWLLEVDEACQTNGSGLGI